jgi:uncharacterized protein YdaU (DUF1376 family)
MTKTRRDQDETRTRARRTDDENATKTGFNHDFYQSPSFQFYPGDFEMGVKGLTNEQIGIYIKLLCIQWCHGRITPLMASETSRNDEAIIEVLTRKFEESEGHWQNARLEEIRHYQEARSSCRTKTRRKGDETDNENATKPTTKSERNRDLLSSVFCLQSSVLEERERVTPNVSSKREIASNPCEALSLEEKTTRKEGEAKEESSLDTRTDTQTPPVRNDSGAPSLPNQNSGSLGVQAPEAPKTPNLETAPTGQKPSTVPTLYPLGPEEWVDKGSPPRVPTEIDCPRFRTAWWRWLCKQRDDNLHGKLPSGGTQEAWLSELLRRSEGRGNRQQWAWAVVALSTERSTKRLLYSVPEEEEPNNEAFQKRKPLSKEDIARNERAMECRRKQLEKEKAHGGK